MEKEAGVSALPALRSEDSMEIGVQSEKLILIKTRKEWMIESSIDELYISSWCRDDIKVETMGRPQMEVKP